MNRQITHVPKTAMLLGIATTLAGVGALLWRTTRHPHVLTTRRPGHPPVWAQASAIVASSASALLLLMREKG
jgi:hypothetical protein